MIHTGSIDHNEVAAGPLRCRPFAEPQRASGVTGRALVLAAYPLQVQRGSRREAGESWEPSRIEVGGDGHRHTGLDEPRAGIGAGPGRVWRAADSPPPPAEHRGNAASEAWSR